MVDFNRIEKYYQDDNEKPQPYVPPTNEQGWDGETRYCYVVLCVAVNMTTGQEMFRKKVRLHNGGYPSSENLQQACERARSMMRGKLEDAVMENGAIGMNEIEMSMTVVVGKEGAV